MVRNNNYEELDSGRQARLRIGTILVACVTAVTLAGTLGALAGCTRGGGTDSTQATAPSGEEATATDIAEGDTTEVPADWIQGGWGSGYVMTHATYGNPEIVNGGTSSYGDTDITMAYDETGRRVGITGRNSGNGSTWNQTLDWEGETTVTIISDGKAGFPIDYKVDTNERVVSYTTISTVISSIDENEKYRRDEWSINRGNDECAHDMTLASYGLDSEYNVISGQIHYMFDYLVFDSFGYPVFEPSGWAEDGKAYGRDERDLTYAYDGSRPISLAVERHTWNRQEANLTYNYDITCDEAGNITEIRDDAGNLVASFEYKRIERMSPVAKEMQLEGRSCIWDAVVKCDEVPRTGVTMSERDAQ